MEPTDVSEASRLALEFVDCIIADVTSARLGSSQSSDGDDLVLAELLDGLQKMRPAVNHNAGQVEPHPARAWLDVALDMVPETARETAQAFAAVAPLLDWNTSYEDVEGPPGFDEFRSNYTYAPVAVPAGWRSNSGPLAVPTVSGPSLFLVIQGPDQVYPGHRHPAVEIYGVVAGTGDWYRGGEGFRPRRPGEIFVHDSDMVHATTTAGEPTISWAAWLGDVNTGPTLTPLAPEP